jgi:hypothetical protein
MDAAKALRELSQPQMRGEKIQVIIERCAHLAGLSYSRAFEIYYGRARRIEPAEIARIAEALDRKNQRDARNEFQELRLRIARLESLFTQNDPDFHREDLAALRSAMSPAGRGMPRSR